MTIPIHKDCKEKLITVLKEGLLNIEANNYNLSNSSYLTILFLKLDNILPTSISKELSTYIVEDNINLYIYDILQDILIDNHNLSAQNEKKIDYKIFDYIDIDETCTNIIEKLDNLPLDFKFVFDVGDELSKDIEEDIILSDYITLTKNISILNSNFVFTTNNPIKDKRIQFLNHPLQIPIKLELISKNTYLIINIKGFVSNKGKTNTTIKAESIYKSFLGLLIAGKVLEFSYSSQNSYNNNYFVFKDNIICSNAKVDDDFGKGLQKLTRPRGLGGLLDIGENTTKFKELLHLSKNLFSNHADCSKLQNSCSWLFDSFCGNNELLSFIQATVTLEILLGEKSESEKMGLSNLLKNRCAYLLGKTNKERTEILHDFEKIYNVRSYIVHRGHPKLNSDEQQLLRRVRILAGQVIIKEMQLL